MKAAEWEVKRRTPILILSCADASATNPINAATAATDILPSYLFKLISTYKFNEASFVAGIILLLSMIIYFFIDNLNYQERPDIKT